jgi:hypothetical protein
MPLDQSGLCLMANKKHRQPASHRCLSHGALAYAGAGPVPSRLASSSSDARRTVG